MYVMRCAIWYHLYNLKNVKNTHGGVLLLLKVTLLHGRISRSLNCANGTKSRKASHREPPNLANYLLRIMCMVIKLTISLG